MKFQKTLLITGKDTRLKKDGTPYYILHILMDNGQTCSPMYRGSIEDFNTLEPMKQYSIEFEVVFSNYGTRIEVLSIARAK